MEYYKQEVKCKRKTVKNKFYIFIMLFLFSIAIFPFLRGLYNKLDISMYPSDTMKFMQNFVNETKKVRLEDKQKVKDNKILFQIQKKFYLLSQIFFTRSY